MNEPMCNDCETNFSEFGRSGCDDEKHRQPSSFERAAMLIASDLSDRRSGLDIDELDDETRNEVIAAWAAIIAAANSEGE